MAPISTYGGLSWRDITDLTAILNRFPLPLIQSEDAMIRRQIRDLPPHLKSIVICIAPGCSLHKRLNTLPLDDIAATFRYEISVCVPQIWFALREAGKLSAEQVYALGMLDAIAGLSITGCAACWLEALASHIEGSIALGAVIIGRVSPEIFEKSKRVLWIEEGVRLSAGEAGVRRMWELGMRFRVARKKNAGAGKGSEFVEEFVRRARQMGSIVSQGSGRSVQAAAYPCRRAVEVQEWAAGVPMDDQAEARISSPGRLEQSFGIAPELMPPAQAIPRVAHSPILDQPPRP